MFLVYTTLYASCIPKDLYAIMTFSICHYDTVHIFRLPVPAEGYAIQRMSLKVEIKVVSKHYYPSAPPTNRQLWIIERQLSEPRSDFMSFYL